MKGDESTVARIAGNLLSGSNPDDWMDAQLMRISVKQAVEAARAIVAEVKRTSPPETST